MTKDPSLSKPTSIKRVEWILRIAVFGTYLGHGVLALQLKSSFLELIEGMSGITGTLAENLLYTIGVIDITTAILAIVYPFRLLLMWATLWGFLTAVARPVSGEPVWDFIERWANWGAPLALLYLRNLPMSLKELFR
ncbi:MAG TPA: hypothetical protein VLA53_07330 [Nitrosopumilaceae archaeon]|nr:hypothetical protein [Nitrosopumilaceae archaeon]